MGREDERKSILIHFDQDAFHGGVQQAAEGVQVLHGGKRLPVLPLVDGLGLLEAEILLHVAHAQPAGAAQALQVGAGGLHVDFRKHAVPPV